jgi:hypothetical protein
MEITQRARNAVNYDPPFFQEMSVRYLRLRPDCEGIPHQLRFCTGKVLPCERSWLELTVAFEGIRALPIPGLSILGLQRR